MLLKDIQLDAFRITIFNRIWINFLLLLLFIFFDKPFSMEDDIDIWERHDICFATFYRCKSRLVGV